MVKTISVRLIIALVVCFPQLAVPDYLEVRRSAYLYSDSTRHSQALLHLDPAASDAPIYLQLEQSDLENGYYHARHDNGISGWVYKSRVRRHPGSLPGAQTNSSTLTISDAPGAINVYFNRSALTQYATDDNRANHSVNLEDRLIVRLNQARSRIDIAVYEINLPRIVNTLIDRAADGVDVRVIADAKPVHIGEDISEREASHNERYEIMSLYLERLRRGRDGDIGTEDDIALFSDSPIFAVSDPVQRERFNLPLTPSGVDRRSVTVAKDVITDYLLVQGERKTNGTYYAAGDQMHNKFAIIDGAWVWTGSWNWTLTGLYGTEANRQALVLEGNTQHSVEIHSPELAEAFTTEFNEMWGGDEMTLDPDKANLHGRKTDNTPHAFTIGGRSVELYFSPGDNAINRLRELITEEANQSFYFSIFAWSDQSLVDALKVKWEGNAAAGLGSLTGFDVKGVFDASFWNAWWSASIEMTGRTGSRVSLENPNTPWAHPAPVFFDNEPRKLHSKTMIIDACTDSDPTVAVGSINWSSNGDRYNDENLLIIHDAAIANQFLQEFYARYQQAGGTLPQLPTFTCD